MRFIFVFIAVLFSATVWDGLHTSLKAQQIVLMDHCDTAKNTSDILTCVKANYDVVQAHLDRVFGAQAADLEGEALERFRAVQKHWITYRNQECAWQGEQEQTQSLKRMKDLTCLIQLTQARSDLLAPAGAEDKEHVTEALSVFPRWMNVLADENPDIYWKYGARQSADMDCDGVDEEILSGIKMAPHESQQSEIILAIVENPATGRPVTDIFNFVTHDAQAENHICSANISFEITPHTPENTGLRCTALLRLKHGKCDSKILQWDGEIYAWQPQA